MSLFLIQHGKSLPKDADPEQGLSDQGIADVKRIAEVAAGYGVRIGEIRHSGKKRARQTAEIFAEALAPERGAAQAGGLKPLDDVAAYAEKIDPADNVMLVGHLPFMERMTAWLVAGVTDKTVFKFQNGGIVCLDRDPESGAWFIKWTLMPHIG